jgi:glutamate/tyrosine decarboxylase-like PLP-dependent enzyme
VAAAVSRDRAAGRRPVAVAAVAGSTNTGSVDPTGALADVCAAEDLWLHVDAAYGGAARLSEHLRYRVADLDRADSVTIDPHKWFFQAYDVGGLMVRDGRHLGQTFSASPEYYGIQGELDFYKLGFEGTRRWRALKLWLSWKHVGTVGLGRLLAANLTTARYLS